MAKRKRTKTNSDDEQQSTPRPGSSRPVAVSTEFGRAVSQGHRDWWESSREYWPKRYVFKGDTYIGYSPSTLVHYWDTELDPSGELPATLEEYQFKKLSACRLMAPGGKLIVVAPEPGAVHPFGMEIPVLAWMFGQWKDDFASLAHATQPNRRGNWRVPHVSSSSWVRVPRGELELTGKVFLHGMNDGDPFPPPEWAAEVEAERQAESQRLRDEMERLRREQEEAQRLLDEQRAEEEAAIEEQDQTEAVDNFLAQEMVRGNTDPEQLARDLRSLGLTATPTHDLSQVPPPRAAVQPVKRNIVKTKTQSRKILRRKRKKKK